MAWLERRNAVILAARRLVRTFQRRGIREPFPWVAFMLLAAALVELDEEEK